MTITKAERTELRSIVKQQFRVLRAEVVQREAELLADVETQITERFAAEDKAWADAASVAYEAVLEANRRINDIYKDLLPERHVERNYIRGTLPDKPQQQRHALRAEAQARVTSQVRGAMLSLDRQEADLLRTLAVGAIESDEARAFLTAIPTVSELVPTARLAELEASLTDEGTR